jgi:hypothetical protein
MSLSYTYGFNNRISQLCVAGALLAVFLWHLWINRSPRSWMGPIASTISLSNPRGDRRLFVWYLGASAFAGAILTAWYCVIPFSRYGEMAYFLSRIDLLILHRAAYYQFPFEYGPAMIYPPYFLYRLAHGLLSVEQAYFILFIGHWVAGYYLLYYCVRLLVSPARQAGVFCVIAVTMLAPSLGMNYTPLRFLLPLASVLWVHSLVTRWRSRMWVGAASFFGPFVSFLFSPEMGLAATLAVAAYFASFVRARDRRFFWLMPVPVVGAVAAVAPWTSHYVGILFTFGSSLPILPGPGVLALILTALLIVPLMARLAVEDSGPAGAAALALCVEFGLLIVPSLTRVDMGHVSSNSAGLFIFALAVASRLGGRWFPLSLWAFLILFAALGNWVFLFHYGYYYHQVAAARADMRAAPAVSADEPAGSPFHFSKPYPPRTGMESLLKYRELGLPLGADEGVERYLKLNGRLAVEFYPNWQPETFTPAQAGAQLRALDGIPAILVPKSIFDPPDPLAPARRVALDSRFLTINELFPIHLHVRNPPYDPGDDLIAGIKSEYAVIGSFRDYYIMGRRSQPLTP